MRPLVINLRGTNGSGKSTLARAWLPEDLKGGPGGGPVDLASYDAPTKKDPARRLRVEGYCRTYEASAEGRRLPPLGVGGPYRIGVVGPYRTACGGMDALPSFAACQQSIGVLLRAPLSCDTVIAEGVLASTVYGSWAEFDRRMSKLVDFAWVYLSTPVELCLERIRTRQALSGKERPIKEDLVRDKVRAIAATRRRALEDGRLVYDLPWQEGDEDAAELALRAIIERQGEAYRAQ